MSAILTAMAVGTLALSGCGSTAESAPGPSVDPVVGAIATRMTDAVKDRLAIMPDVAYVKYVQKLPIDDAVREKATTAAFVKSTTEGGVPPSFAGQVMDAQIQAAKAVQRSLIAQWSTGVTAPPTGPPADLANELRPRIDDATEALATALIQMQSQGVPGDWPVPLDQAATQSASTLAAGVTKTIYAQALEPLAHWPGVTQSPSKSASSSPSESP